MEFPQWKNLMISLDIDKSRKGNP